MNNCNTCATRCCGKTSSADDVPDAELSCQDRELTSRAASATVASTMDARSRPFHWLLVAVLAAAAPGVACAEVYKWIDEMGVVNYGDQPPAGSKNVVALDATTSTLSVVPGLPADALQRELERALEWRVNQLEQELNEQRVRAAISPAAPALDTTGIAMGARLYGYPVAFARTIPPRRPHVRDPRDGLLPTLVRPPEHR